MTNSIGTDTNQTLRALRRIMRALVLDSRDLARQHSLSAPQLLCLRLLKDAGELTAGGLAQRLSLSPATITGLVDRLEARTLIERRRSRNDRRQVVINLSRAGLNIVETTAPPLQERFVKRLAALPEEKRQQIRIALEAVVELLQADTLDAAPLLTPEHAISAEPGNYLTDSVEIEIPSTPNDPAVNSV